MWTTPYSRHTTADPGRVWAVLADIGRWGEWNDGVARIEVLATNGGTTVTYRTEVTGAAPDDVLAEIGSGVTADFPQVLAALAGRAEA